MLLKQFKTTFGKPPYFNKARWLLRLAWIHCVSGKPGNLQQKSPRCLYSQMDLLSMLTVPVSVQEWKCHILTRLPVFTWKFLYFLAKAWLIQLKNPARAF